MASVHPDLAAFEENPYRSPMYGGRETNGRKKVVYRTSREAFEAGMRRCAKFGAKWMGIVLGSLAFILVMFVGVRLILFICRQGYDQHYVLDALFIIVRFLLFTLAMTLGTALISAFMMGVAEWYTHWRSGKKGNKRATA